MQSQLSLKYQMRSMQDNFSPKGRPIDEIGSFGVAMLNAAMLDYLQSNEQKAAKRAYDVLDTVQKCPRYGYLSSRDRAAGRSSFEMDERKTISSTISCLIHSIPASSLHGLTLENFEGKRITATIDDVFVFEDEKIILVQEKKTKSFIPKEIDSQYRKQVERNVAMLVVSMSGSKKEGKIKLASDPLSYTYYVQVVYIDVNEKALGAFTFPVDPEKEVLSLREYIAKFEESEITGVLPPSVRHWLCNFCPFWSACIRYDTR